MGENGFHGEKGVQREGGNQYVYLPGRKNMSEGQRLVTTSGLKT